MSHTFTRQEVFLARLVGAHAHGRETTGDSRRPPKACREADVLLPLRGYWAKLAAGKRVKKPNLPPRRRHVRLHRPRRRPLVRWRHA